MGAKKQKTGTKKPTNCPCWVCEAHPKQPWKHNGCDAAGDLCLDLHCDKDPDPVFVLGQPGKRKPPVRKARWRQGMASKVCAFLVTACLLFAVNATAITGNEWRQLSQTAQQYYIIGVLDGWDNLGTITLLAEQQSPVGIGFTKQIDCTIGMAYPQINAIIQKYMENNPSQWHYSMALLIWPALAEVCAAATK